VNVRLAHYSYYRTGGKCKQFFAPHNAEELTSIIEQRISSGLEYFVLGAGSNSLIMDKDWPGVVISCHNLIDLYIHENLIISQAGVQNSTIAMLALANRLNGFTWMYALPGQIAATVRMNARCYGGEISKRISKIKTIHLENAEQKTYEAEDKNRLFYGYKDTYFMKSKEIIYEVVLQSTGFSVNNRLKEEMLFYKNDRINKGQFLYPSCGCVFKNNYTLGISSGSLLEQAGVKNLNIGMAKVSPQHANFIFNQGATAQQILELSWLMQERVYELFGVWLEYEMEILGEQTESNLSRLKEQRPQIWKQGKLKQLKPH